MRMRLSVGSQSQNVTKLWTSIFFFHSFLLIEVYSATLDTDTGKFCDLKFYENWKVIIWKYFCLLKFLFSSFSLSRLLLVVNSVLAVEVKYTLFIKAGIFDWNKLHKFVFLRITKFQVVDKKQWNLLTVEFLSKLHRRTSVCLLCSWNGNNRWHIFNSGNLKKRELKLLNIKHILNSDHKSKLSCYD
jgi:hypothetical protein